MSAKKFLKTLATQLCQDVTDVPTVGDLRESFKEAVDSLPKGKLRKSLRTDFDTHLDGLHRKISKKLASQIPTESQIPAPYQSDNEGNLSELSTVDERPDVREPGSPMHNKPIFCVIGKLRPPDFSKHKDFTKLKKKRTLCSYIQAILGREEVEDAKIIELLKEVEEYNEAEEEDTKSKFSWRYRMDTLQRLSSLHKDSKVLVRFMRILFSEITKDVEKIIKKEKTVRAGNMSEILHRYLMSCHMRKEFTVTLQEEDKKLYGDLMSALLAFYVDLRLVHASKVPKKKAEGNQLCGLVAYWLKDYPESLLEVVLQLEGPLVEENKNVILPLIGKSLEKLPVRNSHYLKYILVVKTMSQKFGEDELYDELLKARSLSCNKNFLDFLIEISPEVHEEMPTNDKKFKGRKVTKFLLDDVDDNMVSLLLDGLKDVNEDLFTSTDLEDEGLQKVLDILNSKADEKSVSDDLFFIDKGPTSSTLEEPSGSTEREAIPVLKTVKEVEDMLDLPGTKSFKIDPHMIGDDTSDQEFFDSEIVSIESLPQSAKKNDECDVNGASMNGDVLAEDTDETDMEEPIEKTEISKNNDKPLKSQSKPVLSDTDQSVSETDQVSVASTVECDVNSVTSSKAVEVDTESFDISKSELSTDRSDFSKSELSSNVFSADDEVTVVHLGESRNIITDSTEDEAMPDEEFVGDANNEGKAYKKANKDSKKKKSHNDSEVEEILSSVKVKNKKKASRTSNGSVTSQDTSQEESELNKTEKYVDGYPYKSPYSDTKTTRKISTEEEDPCSDENKAGPSKKQKKKKSIGSDEVDASVMKKVSSPTAFEEKFIAKALKKTPKKPKLENVPSKSSEKKKHRKEESLEDAEQNLPKSPRFVEGGKKKVKKASVDAKEVEKDLKVEEKNDVEDNLAVPDEETEKKSGRLTPQKMFEILNDVKQIDGGDEAEGSKDDRSEKGLSEYESESCIEIASESQTDDEQESKQVEQESNAMEETYASENMKYEGEAGTDINESTVSVIDLVSECEDKNNDIVEKTLSEGENLSKSPKATGSKLKSPKLEHPEQKDQDVVSPGKAMSKKLSSLSKDVSPKSSNEKKQLEDDAETSGSPIQTPVKPVTDVIRSPRKTPVKILTPKEKPTMAVDHKDSDTQDVNEDQDELAPSPSKAKTPPNTPASTSRKSPRKSVFSIEEEADIEKKLILSDKRRQKQKSPGHVKSPDSDAEIAVHKSFSDKEYTPGKKRHSFKSSDHEKSGTDIKIPSSHKKKSYPGVSTESESDIDNVPDISQHLKSPLIPVMSVKIHKRKKDDSELENESSALDVSQSESDSERPSPRKKLSAKKPAKVKDKLPVASKSEIDKSSPRDQGSSKKGKRNSPDQRQKSLENSGTSSEEQAESSTKGKKSVKKSPREENKEDNEPSPRKLVKLSFVGDQTELEEKIAKKSNNDIVDFPSETDQSDKDERMCRKSPKLPKLTENGGKTTKRRRSLIVGAHPEKDDVKRTMSKNRRAKSMGAIAEDEEVSEDDEEVESETVEEPKKHKSPIHKRITRQRKVKVPSPAKKAEKIVKEPKPGQKRKSVSYTGLKEKDSEEEVKTKKATPPRPRSTRKSSKVTEPEPAEGSSKRALLPSPSKAKASSPTKKRYSLRNK